MTQPDLRLPKQLGRILSCGLLLCSLLPLPTLAAKTGSAVKPAPKAKPAAAEKPLPLTAYMSFGGDLDSDIRVGEYWFDGKKWHMNARLGIYGVDDFLKLTQKDVKTTNQWMTAAGDPHPPQWEWVKDAVAQAKAGKAPTSLAQIPQIKELIEGQLQDVQKMYNNDFLETSFEVFFLDESKARNGIAQAITKATSRKALGGGKDFLPLLYHAHPNPDIVTPGALDPFGRPGYSAHEIFHLLSRHHFNDGYNFFDYPLSGIMNGGPEFQQLEKLGLQPSMHEVEWKTFLLEQEAFRKKVKPNTLAEKPEFLPNFLYMEPYTGTAPKPWRAFGDLDFPPQRNDLSDEERTRLQMEEKVRLYQESLKKKDCEKNWSGLAR